MTDFRKILADLRRPRLLIRAARFGLADYRRERDLRRIVAPLSTPERTLPHLVEEEDRLETIRQSGDAGLMAEVRLLPRPTNMV